VPLNSAVIIDDDPMQIEILRDALATLSVSNVQAFSNGGAAIRHLMQVEVPPRVIITDLHMPEIDGVELMSFLKLDHARVPLIIISGAQQSTVTAAERLSSALGLNVLGALQKPISLKALEDLISQAE